MKIPFDIKFRPQIESGEYKVETRDGRSVRIICWDRVAKENTDDDLNICVLVSEDNGEGVYYYHQSGKKWVPDERFDLFIITPGPELSEFENKLRVICEDAVRESQLFPERTSEDFAKKHSAELLALARKEPCEQIVDHIKKAYENGKAEALKDLPKWRKCAPSDTDDSTPPAWIVRFDVEREGNESKIVHNGYYIDFGSLERLPGFNESNVKIDRY